MYNGEDLSRFDVPSSKKRTGGVQMTAASIFPNPGTKWKVVIRWNDGLPDSIMHMGEQVSQP